MHIYILKLKCDFSRENYGYVVWFFARGSLPLQSTPLAWVELRRHLFKLDPFPSSRDDACLDARKSLPRTCEFIAERLSILVDS